MKEVEAWVQSLQFLLAQLLDAAAPPKVRCSWLSESMKRCGNFRPGHFTEVSPESMNDQPGDFVEVAQRLRQLLEHAKLELRRQNEVLAAPGLKEAKSPLEILHDLEWVAEQLDEQRMHMNQRHQDELRALQDSGSQESQQKDSDLIQLQLRHDNESLQMTRLLKEQEIQAMRLRALRSWSFCRMRSRQGNATISRSSTCQGSPSTSWPRALQKHYTSFGHALASAKGRKDMDRGPVPFGGWLPMLQH